MLICEGVQFDRTYGPIEDVAGVGLKAQGGGIDIFCLGLEKVKFDVSGGRVLLSIDPLPTGGNFRVVITNGRIATSLPRLPSMELSHYMKGGPPRWTETLETTATLGDDKVGPYTLDQIQLAEKNPWNASIRFAGLDFFADGRAALCTWDGDVWIVSGLDAGLKKVRWKRFAAGLQQPLGLKIINGIIHVAGRDQITKLHDLNNDGEADFYENFNNDAGPHLAAARVRHGFADRQGREFVLLPLAGIISSRSAATTASSTSFRPTARRSKSSRPASASRTACRSAPMAR